MQAFEAIGGRQAVFNLTNTVLGVGVLTVPTLGLKRFLKWRFGDLGGFAA